LVRFGPKSVEAFPKSFFLGPSLAQGVQRVHDRLVLRYGNNRTYSFALFIRQELHRYLHGSGESTSNSERFLHGQCQLCGHTLCAGKCSGRGPSRAPFGVLRWKIGRKPIKTRSPLAKSYSSSPAEVTLRTARKASCGMSTWPTRFMRFLPSFCFSRSLRLREMSPP
jgi:hypothetical protein